MVVVHQKKRQYVVVGEKKMIRQYSHGKNNKKVSLLLHLDTMQTMIIHYLFRLMLMMQYLRIL
jgi:hypothetical protein